MRSTDLTRVLSTALAVAGLAAADNQCSNGRTKNLINVSTTNGAVTGHVAPGTSCVIEYLGIPYAKPPVGNLRFAAPQPIDSQSAYVAANFGADCPLSASKPVDYPDFTPQAQRVINNFASAAGTPQSEDCLTLNIWSHATPKAMAKKKPVLVFFYGGRFSIGNTNSPMYNGKHFAEAQDIVVVTVNYRTNIFGFPGAPGDVQNLGLRDQRAAVEWLRQNVARFGGDANRIVLAGQSSGGVAADYWSYAYEQDPIAAGLILTSGTAFSFPLNAVETLTKNWETVVAAVGCAAPNATTPTTMACMRAVPWEDIKAASAKVKPSASGSVLRSIPAFYPQIDNEIVFPDYMDRTAAGRFAKLPIFAGNNHNEAGYYRIPAYGNGGVIPTDAQVAAFHMESASRRGGYRFLADWENTRLFPTSGAYHGVDLHMVFGGSEESSGIAPSEEQKGLTQVVQSAWFEFAADPWEGLEREMGWPKWADGKASFVVLGKDNVGTATLVKPAEFDAECGSVTMGAIGSSGTM
ncbi:hypothetical protein N0V88_002509 [Collariella sp. IMI 366227]|nr:hypothetical protein N0V88_002509 [Collariella sp. IMI 366227]